jgi:hypothetical protein
MSTAAFSLWGFDGELAGNENRLQHRLPLFTRAGDTEHVYVPRVLHWSETLPEDEVLRVPVAEAARYGEELRSELEKPMKIFAGPARAKLKKPFYLFTLGDVPVRSGQYVVVMGREFLANARAISLIMLKGRTARGAGVQMMNESTVDAMANRLEIAARQRFDREISGMTVTPTAHAALAVMRGTGTGDLRNHLLRTLVVHRLEGDTDQYRRVLRLASVRLKDSENRLEEDLERFLNLTRHTAADQQRVGQSVTFAVVGQKRPKTNAIYPVRVGGSVGYVIMNPKSLTHRTKAETGALDVIVKPERILGQ